MCRCDHNCGTHVERRRRLELVAFCKTSTSDDEVAHPCTGRVQWELHEMGMASSRRPEQLSPPKNWTDLAGGGARLIAPGDSFPDTDNYVVYEIKASG